MPSLFSDFVRISSVFQSFASRFHASVANLAGVCHRSTGSLQPLRLGRQQHISQMWLHACMLLLYYFEHLTMVDTIGIIWVLCVQTLAGLVLSPSGVAV